MRTLDRLLGIPLCWIAGGVLKFLPKRNVDLIHGKEVRNVLFIKFFGLGSIVLSTAALSMVWARFPGSTLTFLSFSSNRGLLERLPLIDDVMTLDPSDPWTFSRDLLSILRRLVRRRYDIVFDFEFFSKFSTLLSGISRAPYRVGFALPARWRSFLITHPVSLVKRGHVMDAFCSQVYALCSGAPASGLVPPTIFPEDAHSVERKIALNGAPFVVINANAGNTFLERRWPPDRFAALISELAGETDYLFVLTGTASERSYVQSVLDQTQFPERCRNVAGRLTTPELGALLRQCSLVISNDSGPLHLAAVLGVPYNRFVRTRVTRILRTRRGFNDYSLRKDLLQPLHERVRCQDISMSI